MNGRQRFAILATALITVNLATWAIVIANQRNGVYPVEADSIGLPILSTLFASCLAMLPLGVISFLPGSKLVARLCGRGLPWVVGVIAVLLLTYLIAVLFSLSGLAYWAVPEHYMISFTYAALLLAIGVLFLVDVKRVLSNRGLQGTQASGVAGRLRP